MSESEQLISKLQNEINELKAKNEELNFLLSVSQKPTLEGDEQKYKSLYENAPIPYQSLNEDGSFRDINTAWLKALGYDREEVIGKKYSDFLHPDWKQHFEINFPAFKARGYVSGVQFKLRRKNGEFIDVEFEGRVGYNPDGSFNQTYCVFSDITKRKKIQEEVQKSEKRFRNLVTNQEEIIYELDANGIFVVSEGKGLAKLGLRPGQVVGLSVFDVYKGNSEILEGIAFAFKGETVTRDVTIGNLHFRNWSTPVFDHERKVIGVIGLAIDITEIKTLEEQRKKSEERFFLAVKGSNDGIWDWENLESDEYWWSDRLYEILGYRPGEVEARISNWKKWMHPDDNDKVVQILSDHFENKGNYRAEFRMKNKAGEYVWLLARGESVRDKNGKPVRMAGSVTDITPRKLIELEMADQKKRLNNILEGTNAGTWEWNVQTGEAIFNERWAGIIGYTLDELKPFSVKTWINSVFPEDINRIDAALKNHFKKKTDYYDEVFRMKHKSGKLVWVNSRGKVTEWSADGQPVWMHGTHIDITELKRVEQELATHKEQLEKLVSERTSSLMESEERMRAIVEDAPMGIAVINSVNGKIMEANAKYAELTGRSRDELKELDWMSITHPDDIKKDLEIMDPLLSGKINSFNTVKRYIKPDGEVVWINLTLSRLRGEDKAEQTHLAITEDITSKKLLEESVQQRNRELEEKNRELDNAMKVFVGRELTVRKLQERIRALEGK